MDPPPDSGPHLRGLREAAGLPRAQIARLADLSETTIRNIESGRHLPTPGMLTRLRAVLRIFSFRT